MARTYGYQPTSDATPGTPSSEPAGASSARHPRLAIRATATGHGGTVTLDGNDISKALTGVTLTLGVGQVPTASLDLLLIDVTEVQDAGTRILIPDATRDALVAIGWTPPADSTEESTDDLDVTPFLVVHRYRTDRGDWSWSWRCWGDGPCDGWLALDLNNRAYAERNARRHLTEDHPAATAVKEG